MPSLVEIGQIVLEMIFKICLKNKCIFTVWPTTYHLIRTDYYLTRTTYYLKRKTDYLTRTTYFFMRTTHYLLDESSNEVFLSPCLLATRPSVWITCTKFRHNCISNYDLYRKHTVDTPNCSCGKQEDANHFFCTCIRKEYSNAMCIMFDKLFALVELSFVGNNIHYFGDRNN